MSAIASALMVMTAFAAQLTVEALKIPNSDEWAGWTGLVACAGLIGFGLTLWREGQSK